MMSTYLIDTNLIVYAYNEDDKNHSRSKEIIEIALNGMIEACIADKNLLEFFAIITDSRRVEKPITIDEATQIVDFLVNSRIKIIYSTPFTFLKTFELVKKYKISKQKIFDMILVALMIENKVHTIFTGNEKDFAGY